MQNEPDPTVVKKMTSPDAWNQRYSDMDKFAYGTEANDFLKTQAPALKPSSKILCIAEGEGRNGVFLAKLGHSVTGVDSSSVGLAKAQALAQQQGVTITTEVADLEEWNGFGSEQWDVIVSIFCHLPPPLRQKVHESCVSALKPGGRMILEGYTPAQLEYKTGGPPAASLMFTKEMLAKDFQGLEVLTNEELVRDVVEGTLHTGKASVVQFVGQKK